MSEPEKKLLICARADSSAVLPRGTIFTQCCPKCGKKVALAPSGQRFLQAHQDTEIVCMFCFIPKLDDKAQLAVAGSPEEIIAELRDTVPNSWRNRN